MIGIRNDESDPPVIKEWDNSEYFARIKGALEGKEHSFIQQIFSEHLLWAGIFLGIGRYS